MKPGNISRHAKLVAEANSLTADINKVGKLLDSLLTGKTSFLRIGTNTINTNIGYVEFDSNAPDDLMIKLAVEFAQHHKAALESQLAALPDVFDKEPS